MKKWYLLLLFLSFGAVAGAQEFPAGPHEFVMAKVAASEGRYDEALSRLEKILEKAPNDPVLLYERAMVFVDAGRLERAEVELRKVVTANPDFFEARRVLGRLILDRAGNDRARVDEALVHLQHAFKLNVDDLSTGVAVSQLLVASGRVAEAEKVLATLLERAPDLRAINYNYAQVLTKLGRGDESRHYLERAVQLDPTFGPAIFQLVDIYQNENEWEKAAQLLAPLVDEDPLNLDMQRQQAFFFLRAGNAEKARQAFKALTDADPKDLRSQYYLAESLNDLQQYAEADRIYRRLLEKTPDDPDTLASFGLNQVGQRNWDDGAKAFQQLLALPRLPDNLMALAKTQLALIALQRGRYEDAIETAKSVFIFRDKPNGQAINIALDANKRQKKYGDALDLLRPLMEKFPTDPFVGARYIELLVRAGEKEKAATEAAAQLKLGTRHIIAVAEAYIQAEDRPTAVTFIRDALSRKPDDIDLQFELGSVYERAGDRPAAEKVFLGILEKHPEHASTLNYLGYMWAERGINLERAADMLNRAVTQDPRNGAYIDSLGWVYFQQGKLELAEKYLTDATKLLPNDATVHEHLGDVFAKRGDYHKAIQLYRVALTLDVEEKDEVKLRSKIADLEKQSTTAQR